MDKCIEHYTVKGLGLCKFIFLKNKCGAFAKTCMFSDFVVILYLILYVAEFYNYTYCADFLIIYELLELANQELKWKYKFGLCPNHLNPTNTTQTSIV